MKIEPINPYRNIPQKLRPVGYYVYFHHRATDHSVFYVGKGKNERGWRVGKRTKHWRHVAIKNGFYVSIHIDNLSEAQAQHEEVELIAKIGLDKLVNISIGGESGRSGIPAHNRKKVECSNGMVFDSCADAEIWACGSKGDSAISAVCRGKHKSAYGYDWKYVGSDKVLEYISKSDRMFDTIGKPVIDDCGNEFPSASSAARHYGIGNAGVSLACRTGKMAYGRYWKYK